MAQRTTNGLGRCSQCKDSTEVVIESGRWLRPNGVCNRCHSECGRNTPEKRDAAALRLRRFFERNRMRVLAGVAKRRQADREAAIRHYGGECACCGEETIEFLEIDHIQGGGKKHRRSIGGNIWAWMRRNGYPDGFRVLCSNCNFSIGRFGYCPHEREKEEATA